MKITHKLSSWTIVGILFVIFVVGWIIVYEPVTRNLIAQDALCNYCHLAWEYNADQRLTASRPHGSAEHPATTQPRCVECHLPEGWWNTTYAYTHFLSITDLYGHFRDRAAERAGDWIPPSAARAYRVRDRMFETKGATCRTCHIESEIKFTRERGVNAHKLALKESKTCIECHNNLVHRQIAIRKNAFKRAEPSKG